MENTKDILPMGFNINGEEIISNEGIVNAELGAKAITELPDGTTPELSTDDELGIYDAQSGELKRFTLGELDESGVISGGNANPSNINVETIQVTAASGIGMTVTSDVSIGGTVTANFANVTNANVGAALTVAGVTQLFDHLIIDDGTVLASEYALNVKNSGTSAFGVLGNGAVLLGNSSASPFIAVNDHHATSKKYVDDAITAGVSAGVVTALDDIGNVDAPSPTNGQMLSYNSTTSEWEAVDPVAASLPAFPYNFVEDSTTWTSNLPAAPTMSDGDILLDTSDPQGNGSIAAVITANDINGVNRTAAFAFDLPICIKLVL